MGMGPQHPMMDNNSVGRGLSPRVGMETQLTALYSQVSILLYKLGRKRFNLYLNQTLSGTK
jgi:hypothetical protein